MAPILSVLLAAGCAAALAQRPGPRGTTCSTREKAFATGAALSECEAFSHGNAYDYPADFAYKSKATWYTCAASGLRVVRSNGIPDHYVKVDNPNKPCEHDYQVELPLNPTLVSSEAEWSEPGALGVIAMQLNGVPAYGAQEAGGENAVLGLGVPDAKYWYGHAARQSDWHYHHPWMGAGADTPAATTLLGYALDGFPIYGPLADPSPLDACNGRAVADNGSGGAYQYHVRAIDTVDGTAGYCNGTSPAIQWNYIVGCFRGDMGSTVVSTSAARGALPADCVEDAPTAFAAAGLRGSKPKPPPPHGHGNHSHHPHPKPPGPPEPKSCMAAIKKLCGDCAKSKDDKRACFHKCIQHNAAALKKAGCKAPHHADDEFLAGPPTPTPHGHGNHSHHPHPKPPGPPEPKSCMAAIKKLCGDCAKSKDKRECMMACIKKNKAALAKAGCVRPHHHAEEEEEEFLAGPKPHGHGHNHTHPPGPPGPPEPASCLKELKKLCGDCAKSKDKRECMHSCVAKNVAALKKAGCKKPHRAAHEEMSAKPKPGPKPAPGPPKPRPPPEPKACMAELKKLCGDCTKAKNKGDCFHECVQKNKAALKKAGCKKPHHADDDFLMEN